MKPILLFDNDGTLVDTTKIIQESFRYVFSKYMPEKVLTDEEYDGFLGPSLEDSFKKYFDEKMVNELCDCYTVYNNQLLLKVEALEHVKECIEKWHQEGYRMGIISVKYRDKVLVGLDSAGINKDYFEVILGGRDFKEMKPSPEGLLKACEIMGVSNQKVVYVGDAPSDVKAAKNMNAISIGISKEEKRKEKLRKENPDYLVNDFLEIDQILKEMK